MIDLNMSQAERDAALSIICYALARPDHMLAPCTTTLPMHHWLIDRGMAPGIINDMPGWTVWDIDAARAAAGTMPLRTILIPSGFRADSGTMYMEPVTSPQISEAIAWPPRPGEPVNPL